MSLPPYPPPTPIAGAAAPAARDYAADVIILALDRAEETVAAIASARAQKGVSRHVWIADQGSTPENLARLAAAVDGAADATLVRLDRNWGVAGGRNRVTALGTGRVVFALDNDAEFATGLTLAATVAALDAAPALGAIACRIIVFDSGADDLSSWGYPQALLPRAAGSFDTVTFVGAGHALRRAAFAAAGGYDDALFFAWEEYDLALRLINLGYGIRYRGDIVVRHKVSGERRVAWGGNRWFHFVRNRLYIARKYGTPAAALLPRSLGPGLAGHAADPDRHPGRRRPGSRAGLRRDDADAEDRRGDHRSRHPRRLKQAVRRGFATTDPEQPRQIRTLTGCGNSPVRTALI